MIQYGIHQLVQTAVDLADPFGNVFFIIQDGAALENIIDDQHALFFQKPDAVGQKFIIFGFRAVHKDEIIRSFQSRQDFRRIAFQKRHFVSDAQFFKIRFGVVDHDLKTINGRDMTFRSDVLRHQTAREADCRSDFQYLLRFDLSQQHIQENRCFMRDDRHASFIRCLFQFS